MGAREPVKTQSACAAGGETWDDDLGMRRVSIVIALVLSVVWAGLALRSPTPRSPDTDFRPLGALIESFSEPGGYFDTDNLISNETAYLQVADRLATLAPGGGYIGVGPDQNFSYIARTRPSWAFIVDIRRDNMLQHLLLGALLERARTPREFLCLLLSRDCLPTREAPGGVAEVLRSLRSAAPRAGVMARTLAEAETHISTLGVELTATDREHIASILRSFYRGQLALRFTTHGRAPMPYHPTFETLLLARSPSGRFGSYLDSADDYAFIRALARDGRLVPLVGDFAGSHTLGEVSRFLEERDVKVAALYVSNVEFYLLRDGRFDSFVEHVRALPIRRDAVMIRAYFDYGRPHPQRRPGHRSTTVLQPIRSFLELHEAGALNSFWDLSTLGILSPDWQPAPHRPRPSEERRISP